MLGIHNWSQVLYSKKQQQQQQQQQNKTGYSYIATKWQSIILLFFVTGIRERKKVMESFLSESVITKDDQVVLEDISVAGAMQKLQPNKEEQPNLVDIK